MDDLTKSIIAFRFASEEDLSMLQARLRAASVTPKFEWHLRESYYEGSYLMGAISGDPQLWKVRLFKDGDGFEAEIWFNSRPESVVLGTDELQARARMVSDLRSLLSDAAH